MFILLSLGAFAYSEERLFSYVCLSLRMGKTIHCQLQPHGLSFLCKNGSS